MVEKAKAPFLRLSQDEKVLGSLPSGFGHPPPLVNCYATCLEREESFDESQLSFSWTRHICLPSTNCLENLGVKR